MTRQRKFRRQWDYVANNIQEARQFVLDEQQSVREAEGYQALRSAKACLRHAEDELRAWEMGIVPPFEQEAVSMGAAA